MVGWSRRSAEDRARYRRWRSRQSEEELERHDLLRDIENQQWGVGCMIVGVVFIVVMLLATQC